MEELFHLPQSHRVLSQDAFVTGPTSTKKRHSPQKTHNVISETQCWATEGGFSHRALVILSVWLVRGMFTLDAS